MVFFGFVLACVGQQAPNIERQREAMKKLEFLEGNWSGEAVVAHGRGETLKATQTEQVQYKLDGLVMLIEGASRDANGKIVFRALATVSYDDATSAYHFRAYNDGRYLDTLLTVVPNGFEWGYANGPVKVRNTMRIEKGEWVETTETIFGSGPASKALDMTLKRQG